MRQFILAKNVAYASGSNLNAVADGRYDWRIERFMRNNDISRTP